MAGTATETGQTTGADVLIALIGALSDGPAEREPTPTPPTIARPVLIAGMSLTTVLLLGIGGLLLFKFTL